MVTISICKLLLLFDGCSRRLKIFSHFNSKTFVDFLRPLYHRKDGRVLANICLSYLATINACLCRLNNPPGLGGFQRQRNWWDFEDKVPETTLNYASLFCRLLDHLLCVWAFCVICINVYRGPCVVFRSCPHCFQLGSFLQSRCSAFKPWRDKLSYFQTPAPRTFQNCLVWLL